MFSSVSPYALLRASKPKAPPTITTSYDLYSAVSQSGASMDPFLQAQTSLPEPQPVPLPSVAASAVPPARKTHYIADIQSRHSTASRQARMSQPVSPSRQEPST